MSPDRLAQQLSFVLEIDRLKSVMRRTVLLDSSRQENSAEHSWHLALMAIVLAEHSAEPVDLAQVIRLVLVHDLVEIDAGDTFCYDEAGNVGKLEREQAAADRIFALLPAEQAAEMRALWDEFETRETPEARFANSLDRLQPMLHNYETRGGSWRKHRVKPEQVLKRNQPIEEGAPALWEHVRGLIDDAVRRGWFEPAPDESR